jgi:CubicO group peptidase (beta-lactamase class C family)
MIDHFLKNELRFHSRNERRARVFKIPDSQGCEESDQFPPFSRDSQKMSYTPFGLQGLMSSPTSPSGESRFIMAGGGMTSIPDAFAALHQLYANGGTYHGSRIASERGVATMHTRQDEFELLTAAPYGNDYGLAFFPDRLDGKGQAQLITHPGLFGTTTWLDKYRELMGVLFVQSNFLRILSLVRYQPRMSLCAPTGSRGSASKEAEG